MIIGAGNLERALRLGDRLGAAARDRACSEFSATVWLDRLRALYLQAMGDRR